MRWIKKYFGVGDTRVVKRFAWFPVTIGAETRWLETVYICQRYGWSNYRLIEYQYQWVNQYFVERDEYETFKKGE